MALNLNIISKFNPKGVNEAKVAFGGIGSAIGKFAGIAATAFATIGAGQFLKDSIKQASDLGESINAVNKAYGNYAKDVLALGDDVASRLGLATVDFNAAAVRFSAFAEKVVGEGGNVAGFVGDLTTRAADFASVFNIDVSEALQVFQSGLSGEAEPLKRFGINLLDSEVKAYAYANGIANVGAKLTETEKVQARYGLLLQSTAKTAGDFADTSNGLANSQRILAANVQNLQAQIGENLTPVMATLTTALVPLVEYVFPLLANFLNKYIVPGATAAANAFKAFTADVKENGLDLGKIFSDLSDGVANFLGAGGLQKAFDRIEEMRMDFFKAVTEALPGIIQAFINFIPPLVNFLVNDLLPLLLKEFVFIIKELANVVAKTLPVLVETLLAAVPDLLKGATTLFNTLVEAVIDIVPSLIRTIADLLPVIVKSILKMLPDIIKSAVELFSAIVTAIPQIIPPLIDALIDLLPVIIDTIIDMLPELIRAAFQLFTGLVQGIIKATPQILDAVIGLIPKITNALLMNMPKLLEAGFEIVKGLAQGILENAPRILGEAAKSMGTILVNGVKGLLGIRSPSRVFYDLGIDVGEGFVMGMKVTIPAIEDIATEMALAAANKAQAALNKAGITQIYSNFGVPVNVTTRTGQLFDVGKATDDINAIYDYMGAKTAEQMREVEKFVFGMSFQEALDTLFVGVNDGTEQLTNAVQSVLDSFSNLSRGVSEAGIMPDEVNPFLNRWEESASGGGGGTQQLLGTGGFVQRPISAIVGEAGPEVVMPLDRFENLMGIGGSGGAASYNITINAGIGSDPVSIGRYVTDAIKRYEAVSGKVFVSA
jgi:phage-related protein